MSSLGGNGMRYVDRSVEALPALSESQIDEIVQKVAKATTAEKTDSSGLLKTIVIIIGAFISVAGLVWTASAVTASKASASDVVQLDKSLGEIKMSLEHISLGLQEVKKDVDDINHFLNKR